jgi:hypothetical protein
MGSRTKRNEVLRCSFCGKDQHDVKKLIAGPSVYICNECIDICEEIIEDDRDQIQRDEPSSGKARIARRAGEPRVRCPLCRTFVLFGEVLLIPERGHLCLACTAAVRAALDESPPLPS